MTCGRRGLGILGAAIAMSLQAGGASAADRFRAVLHDGDHEQVVGQISLGPDGRLRLLSSGQDRVDWLRDIVRRTNAVPVMHLDTPPPPNAPLFTDASRIVPRGDPDFPKALRDYLLASYHLELRAAGG